MPDKDRYQNIFVKTFCGYGICLVMAACLSGTTLLAQTNDGSGSKTGDKKDQSSSSSKPVAAGVAVDSARKSSDLPVSQDQTDSNPGEMAGGYEIRQSAEFGGRITDFT